MIAITYISIIAGVINPVYVYYRDGISYFLMGTDTPFCDKGSTAELYFNMIYTSVITFVTVCGAFSIQFTCAIVCNTIDVTTDITILELDELSELLEQNHLADIEIQMGFKRAIRQILRTDKCVTFLLFFFENYIKINIDTRFVRDYRAWSYWYTFISPYVLTYSIALSIYTQYIVSQMLSK